MKNRKKKTGMIPVVALVMILMAAVGLFPCEKALAAEQVKAVTAFYGAPQLFEEGSAVKLPKIGIPHIELPEIDFSKLDKETEKGKLREALEEMDRLGISPKMLLQRAWNLILPKRTGKQTGEKADSQEAAPVTEKAKKKSSGEFDEAEEPVTERVKKKASEEFDKAVDQAAEKVKEKASEELDKAVEQTIGKGEM